MDRFQNKYRIASARAQWWDYGWNGAYFITICTANREHYFGEIICKDEIHRISLSVMGQIAHTCWNDIPNHFPFVELGDFVVMPNHVHGIVIINKPNDGRNVVETQNFASLQPSQFEKPSEPQSHSTQKHKNQFGPQSKNLASIVRGFKIGVTKNARLIQADFAWQSRFHDHIIRNDVEYQRISDYIINNPANWNDDKFFYTMPPITTLNWKCFK